MLADPPKDAGPAASWFALMLTPADAPSAAQERMRDGLAIIEFEALTATIVASAESLRLKR